MPNLKRNAITISQSRAFSVEDDLAHLETQQVPNRLTRLGSNGNQLMVASILTGIPCSDPGILKRGNIVTMRQPNWILGSWHGAVERSLGKSFSNNCVLFLVAGSVFGENLTHGKVYCITIDHMDLD
jgi:predicted NBD/HSP70 family sugar kinase